MSPLRTPGTLYYSFRGELLPAAEARERIQQLATKIQKRTRNPIHAFVAWVALNDLDWVAREPRLSDLLYLVAEDVTRVHRKLDKLKQRYLNSATDAPAVIEEDHE